MKQQNIIIFGSTSAIAEECAKLWAANECSIVLIARKPDVLEQQKQDLIVRGAKQCHCIVQDLNDDSKHAELIEECVEKLGKIDVALIAYGVLGEQIEDQNDYAKTQSIFQTNLLSPISILTHILPTLESQRSGSLAVITSVAGDRGRQSNYIYGASKGGLALFLQGLRNRVSRMGIQVLDIKPGFVDTPMTEKFDKGPLFVKPEVIAEGIHKAIEAKKNIVYLPWFWRPIMTIIKSIPEFIFKKLKL